MVSYHTALGMYQKPPSTGSATSSPGVGSTYHQTATGHHMGHHMMATGHHTMPHHHSPPSPWYHHPPYGVNSSNQQLYQYQHHQAQYLPNCLHESGVNSSSEQQNFTNLYHNLYQQQQPQNWGSDFHFAEQQNLAGGSALPLNGGNIVPSPPITVSGGSEISSPGGGTNGDVDEKPGSGGRLEVPGGGAGGANRGALVRSPYEWMKKPSYQSQPNPANVTVWGKFIPGNKWNRHKKWEL
ncbi:homeotic protein caudal-like [Ctenocephalides felis]|uniref:homeotic protein caudal-like n=1 Tax=Ctenocephalides felis TaxID=7515 RepID=UPI000E6E186B|nr:homeotic protein caudal-like [Ctenocephalides felis]